MVLRNADMNMDVNKRRETPGFYLSIFFQYAAQYLKTRLTYRVDMLVEIMSDLLFQAVNLIFILVVFGHTTLLAGWTREEIIFIYGFFLVPFSLFSAFFSIWDFNDRYIVKGEFDRILTRPVHSMFQIIIERMELESLFGVVTGLVVMGYAAMHMDLSLTWYDPFIFILMAVGGACSIIAAISASSVRARRLRSWVTPHG
jgi:ABC-2 type transport system permease protein